MTEKKPIVYPYIPNSAPAAKAAMLAAIGAKSAGELYEDIPAPLRLKRLKNLPEPLPSECALTRHVDELLGRNVTPATASPSS